MSQQKNSENEYHEPYILGLPDPPLQGWAGLAQNWQYDVLSGFLVFLVALPLCLGISIASNFPPAAGLFTAIIGGVIVGLMRGSHLTIKGPAAGLIAIVLASVQALGNGDIQIGYKATLAVIVVAALIQVLLGWFKAGNLVHIFPAAAVHGMLAAIGIIIFSKQVHAMFGVKATGKEPLELLAEIPNTLVHHNPFISIIGLFSLFLLITIPSMDIKWLKKVPSQLVVLVAAIGLTSYFSLQTTYVYSFDGVPYQINDRFLVNLPANLFSAIIFPDFTALLKPAAWGYVFLFAIVGSMESLLTCQAVDAVDPFTRKTNMNKSLLTVGIGNVICGLIGGLPMISEVVRSTSNVANGARTYWANVFHGLFLLAFVVFLPDLLHRIPLAALAAMLAFTGYRLASPKIFINSWKEGHEQFLIFFVTIIVTVASDLLIGVSAGILVNLAFHFVRGAQIKTLFKPIFAQSGTDNVLISYSSPAIFSNYLVLDKALVAIPVTTPITVDFTNAALVDHTTQERLHELDIERKALGGSVTVIGLENHKAVAKHPLATKMKHIVG
jgi:MFS superfamily sulfate permease-like transporter